jgi:hypothetical protein
MTIVFLYFANSVDAGEVHIMYGQQGQIISSARKDRLSKRNADIVSCAEVGYDFSDKRTYLGLGYYQYSFDFVQYTTPTRAYDRLPTETKFIYLNYGIYNRNGGFFVMPQILLGVEQMAIEGARAGTKDTSTQSYIRTDLGTKLGYELWLGKSLAIVPVFGFYYVRKFNRGANFNGVNYDSDDFIPNNIGMVLA